MDKLIASETLTALLCDPSGEISIVGSKEDKVLLQKAIEQVRILEINTDMQGCRKCPLYVDKVSYKSKTETLEETIKQLTAKLENKELDVVSLTGKLKSLNNHDIELHKDYNVALAKLEEVTEENKQLAKGLCSECDGTGEIQVIETINDERTCWEKTCKDCEGTGLTKGGLLLKKLEEANRKIKKAIELNINIPLNILGGKTIKEVCDDKTLDAAELLGLLHHVQRVERE
jgi:hypothetical protein